MTTAMSTAINAYVDAVKRGGVAAEPQEQSAGGNFAELMKSVGESALEAGNKADQLSVAAVDGNANVAEVVTAVANAELALQTVVAVRDQVFQAYQEILRMPI